MYKPLQKKDSSWNPPSIQKKGKGKPGTFTVQTFEENVSNSQQDVPKAPRVSSGMMENVMRNMARQQQEHEAALLQRQSEAGFAPVTDVGMEMGQSPVTEVATPEVQSQKIGIQRECADCAKEKQEESAAEGKDVSEISVAANSIQTKPSTLSSDTSTNTEQQTVKLPFTVAIHKDAPVSVSSRDKNETPQDSAISAAPEKSEVNSWEMPEIPRSQGINVNQDAVTTDISFKSSIINDPSILPVATHFGNMKYDFGFIFNNNYYYDPKKSTYYLSGVLDFTARWAVKARWQIDIASENDPDITCTNYTQVANDLTPNMNDLGGRPPRTQFWAKDLSQKHELFHANDAINYCQSYLPGVLTWIGQQNVSSWDGVWNTFAYAQNEKLLPKMIEYMGTDQTEKRAYGDGAPDYLARANAINQKGNQGLYCAPSNQKEGDEGNRK